MTDPKDWKKIRESALATIASLTKLIEAIDTTHPHREEKGIEEDALFGDLTDDEWEELRTHGIHQ